MCTAVHLYMCVCMDVFRTFKIVNVLPAPCGVVPTDSKPCSAASAGATASSQNAGGDRYAKLQKEVADLKGALKKLKVTQARMQPSMVPMKMCVWRTRMHACVCAWHCGIHVPVAASKPVLHRTLPIPCTATRSACALVAVHAEQAHKLEWYQIKIKIQLVECQQYHTQVCRYECCASA